MEGFEPLYPPHCSPQIRSAPPRQVRPTSAARRGFTDKVLRLKKGQKLAAKTRIYTRKRGSSSGIKEHTSTISWFVRAGAGGRRAGPRRRRRSGLVNSNHRPTSTEQAAGTPRSRTRRDRLLFYAVQSGLTVCSESQRREWLHFSPRSSVARSG